ncbi:MAG: GNAT family N-acetyltransferase [Lysobacter sp.]|nr:GNAT family N-acetyltransferase [Lysobacter sp.]
MNLAIRRATPADADALSAIGARTFTDTFGHLYAPEDLQAFLDESHTPAAYAGYLGDPAYALWVLEDAAGVHGYALAGPARLPHADVRAGDGELKRLYVDRTLYNGGWGGKLFAEALAWLERDGPRTLWISVWSENLGAQRFYARHGFGFVGEYEFPVGAQRDREFMFRRTPGA